PKRLQYWATAGLVLVIGQIALGGWVSSNYAAVACVDLPTCHGQWWPTADFANGFHLTQHIGPNYLGGQLDSEARTAIHLT
ncbi:COX15/CtaA family protein, partial [Vibrio cholerae]